MKFDLPTVQRVIDRVLAAKWTASFDTDEEPNDTIVAGPYSIRTVVGGYTLEKAVPVHNYPHEPDSVDVVQVGGSCSLASVIRFLVEDDVQERLEVVFAELDWEEFKEAGRE